MVDTLPPMRILMLITNLGQGGAERVFHDHSVAFSSHAHVEQAVFSGDYEHAYHTDLILHHLAIPRWLSRLGPPGRLIGRALALRRMVRAGGFDVVISHMDGANWVNALSRSHASKVMVVHGTVLHDGNQSGWRQWLRTRLIIPYVYNRADATVAVSEGISAELVGLGVRNAESIPNFFDLEMISARCLQPVAVEHKDLFDGAPVLINSGRLSMQKNQCELLRLFALIKKRRGDLRLAIMGDGVRRAELLTLCADLALTVSHPWEPGELQSGHDADVHFLGYQTNPFAYLSRATLFLFPSAWEGFPLALCEAMACGIPVLSADCPTGPREILAPGSGNCSSQATTAEHTESGVLLPMLQDSKSRAIWADAVLKLLNSPSEMARLSRGGTKAVSQLDRAVVLGRWHALFRRVVGGGA